jgi:hypothetical protein
VRRKQGETAVFAVTIVHGTLMYLVRSLHDTHHSLEAACRLSTSVLLHPLLLVSG